MSSALKEAMRVANRRRYAKLVVMLVVLGLAVAGTPAAAIVLSEQAKQADRQTDALFIIGALVLAAGAGLGLRAVLKRPQGARFWEAVLVVGGLGVAVVGWGVACVVIWWNLLLPG